MKIELIEAKSDLREISCKLIQDFWWEHNHIKPSEEEAILDFQDWTMQGHKLFLVKLQEKYVGFAHLGNRGAEADWLEEPWLWEPGDCNP